jgi:hypothetical protein
MKKIVLLLIFLCTISFSNTIGGFGDLKWGASREEVKKYLMETYDLKEYSIYELKEYTQATYQSIKFGDVGLREINFYYNEKGQFYQWRAESYTIKYDKTHLIDRYKKAYDLDEEKKANGIISLTGLPESEAILIQVYPDKIKFNFQDFNYTFPK